jgi:hypothetical protein
MPLEGPSQMLAARELQEESEGMAAMKSQSTSSRSWAHELGSWFAWLMAFR